jgi:hypothetical protein
MLKITRSVKFSALDMELTAKTLNALEGNTLSRALADAFNSQDENEKGLAFYKVAVDTLCQILDNLPIQDGDSMIDWKGMSHADRAEILYMLQVSDVIEIFSKYQEAIAPSEGDKKK